MSTHTDRKIREMVNRLAAAVDLVEEQARDEGLWAIAVTAMEGHLQQELRKLHAALEERKSG